MGVGVSEYLRGPSLEKLALDWFLAGTLGAVAFIAGSASEVVIKTVNGTPIFFQQDRAGLGHESFSMFKFRTMDGEGNILKGARYLRRAGLDESPQVINIFRGDMSFVGPRGLPVSDDNEIRRRMHGHGIVEQVDNWLELKELVRPGIVSPGVSFTNGLHHDSVAKMLSVIQKETQYMQHAGIKTDVRILARAPLALLLGHNPIIPKEGLALPPEDNL